MSLDKLVAKNVKPGTIKQFPLKIAAGQRWVHFDGGVYEILDPSVKLKCPHTGVWLDAVLYTQRGGPSFVREKQHFLVRFREAR